METFKSDMKYRVCWQESEHLSLSHSVVKHVNEEGKHGDNHLGRVWQCLLNLGVSMKVPHKWVWSWDVGIYKNFIITCLFNKLDWKNANFHQEERINKL